MNDHSSTSKDIDSTEDNKNESKQKHAYKSALKRKIPQVFNRLIPTPELTTYGGIKLGWIQGVLIPCLLNIWGVTLFLRLSWVVAQTGIFFTTIIILVSSLVCTITTLSLSAICTNGELQGGGVYYLVSRSLGAELGASVGLIFAFANSVGASLNIIGFCESLNGLLRSHNLKIIDNHVNDARIMGAIALVVMCFICAIGMEWESKVQNFLIVIIVAAILDFVIGAFYGPKKKIEIAKGFIGISKYTTKTNWHQDYRYYDDHDQNFFSVFAIYFPAVTGVQAGANICGDLKNPAKAIPKGTLLAVLISTSSYLTMAVLMGTGSMRDASGNTTNLTYEAIESCKPNCSYGLYNDYGISAMMALWSPLIYGGCWTATLSTALTNLLSVPRLIQALGIDCIYPGLIFFSKPYGKHGEPYRGYILTFFVSLAFVLIADLNAISPLITNFYLASYALINFCTFHASFISHISWRPTFKYHNTWISFLGFVLCLTMMVIISWMMALLTIIIFLTLYLLVLYRRPDVNWGSSTDAQKYRSVVMTLLHITNRTENIKSYNPQVLALAGRPFSRPALLDVGNLITKAGSFMIVADINETEMPSDDRLLRCEIGQDWLYCRKDRGFFVTLDAHDLVHGVRALVQSAGIGSLSPNILLIGYKTNWTTNEPAAVICYIRMLQTAYEQQLSLTIVRVPDITKSYSERKKLSFKNVNKKKEKETHVKQKVRTVMHSDSDIILHENIDLEITNVIISQTGSDQFSGNSLLRMIKKGGVKQDVADTKLFQSKRKTWYNKEDQVHLDAWWLYDDGGLNILLPYIIAQYGFKEKMCLRIFALAKESHPTEEAYKQIRHLLEEFRIDYSQLTILSGMSDEPTQTSWDFFNNLIKKFTRTEKTEYYTSEKELTQLKLKTKRHLRIRELLFTYSTNASLVVMTLPLPRKDSVSATLYMSWLEALSRDLPPMLFVRGNQTTVMSIKA